MSVGGLNGSGVVSDGFIWSLPILWGTPSYISPTRIMRSSMNHNDDNKEIVFKGKIGELSSYVFGIGS